MKDQMGGMRRYATNNAPPVATIVNGSADVMVSIVEEAIGLATSITFVVCFAAVCNQNRCFTHQFLQEVAYMKNSYFK